MHKNVFSSIHTHTHLSALCEKAITIKTQIFFSLHSQRGHRETRPPATNCYLVGMTPNAIAPHLIARFMRNQSARIESRLFDSVYYRLGFVNLFYVYLLRSLRPDRPLAHAYPCCVCNWQRLPKKLLHICASTLRVRQCAHARAVTK